MISHLVCYDSITAVFTLGLTKKKKKKKKKRKGRLCVSLSMNSLMSHC